MANYGYLPNVQRLQLKAMGVQSVVDLDKAKARADAMKLDVYIPGLPAAEAEPEPEPDPGPDAPEGGSEA